MRTGQLARRVMLLTTLTALLVALSGGAQAAVAVPRVKTGGARHVLTASAQITGVVTPNGTPTSYYFQWGTTTAYGQQTPTVSAGSGGVAVKVGQSIGPLLPGVVYHFRLVGVYGSGQTVVGLDHSFTSKSIALKFALTKLPAITVGTPFILSGALSGQGAAHHAVALQANPFPYTQAFTTIGLPGATDSFGRFSFRVNNLTTSTEFRVITLDSRPVYSPVEVVHAALKVSLHVRRTRHVGVVRLYGTASPAAPGAQVFFQLRKRARPGTKASEKAAEEEEVALVFGTQFRASVKRGGKTFSRFSLTVHVRHAGLYRALVKPRSGGYVAGTSGVVRLRAVPAKHHRRHK
jgi:hypothetical protein